jgi:hypothetical protein
MKKAGQAPHFVIEHVPELLGNMFIPAENMRGQASMGAGCGVFLIPQKRDKWIEAGVVVPGFNPCGFLAVSFFFLCEEPFLGINLEWKRGGL